jgi:hypothetical protein
MVYDVIANCNLLADWRHYTRYGSMDKARVSQAMKVAMLLLLAGLSIAHAAERRGTLTLACEGTGQTQGIGDGKPWPIATGLIIDFPAHTVDGIEPGMMQMHIVEITETAISFAGDTYGGIQRIHGTIDRVTGTLEAYFFSSPKEAKISWNTTYLLQCKPTQRMF